MRAGAAGAVDSCSTEVRRAFNNCGNAGKAGRAGGHEIRIIITGYRGSTFPCERRGVLAGWLRGVLSAYTRQCSTVGTRRLRMPGSSSSAGSMQHARPVRARPAHLHANRQQKQLSGSSSGLGHTDLYPIGQARNRLPVVDPGGWCPATRPPLRHSSRARGLPCHAGQGDWVEHAEDSTSVGAGGPGSLEDHVRPGLPARHSSRLPSRTPDSSPRSLLSCCAQERARACCEISCPASTGVGIASDSDTGCSGAPTASGAASAPLLSPAASRQCWLGQVCPSCGWAGRLPVYQCALCRPTACQSTRPGAWGVMDVLRELSLVVV